MSKQAGNDTTHLFATIGSLTQRGGRVTCATSGLSIIGLIVARVGDVVTYPDGSEAVIIDGAGAGAVCGDKPFALVGSSLSNGDRIIETLQPEDGITESPDAPIPGLFDPKYVPPELETRHRFAVRGSTTARGGVLREPTSKFEASASRGNAARVGDIVHYADGSKATIVSGLGLADNPEFVPLAVVGSELDNGDVITDSPHREEQSSAIFAPVRPSTMTR